MSLATHKVNCKIFSFLNSRTTNKLCSEINATSSELHKEVTLLSKGNVLRRMYDLQEKQIFYQEETMEFENRPSQDEKLNQSKGLADTFVFLIELSISCIHHGCV